MENAHLKLSTRYAIKIKKIIVLQVYDALDDSRVLRVRGVKNVEDNQVKKGSNSNLSALAPSLI